MPIEKKDLLEFLGLKEEPENIDAFKEHFSKDFIARSAAPSDPEIVKAAASKLGNVMGKAESMFKQELKYFGIDKVDGDKLEEIIPSGLGALKTQFETLKEKDKKTKDQRFTELETDLNKYKSQFESEKERADKANKLLEEKDKEVSTFKKNWTIEQQLGEVYKAVPFTDDYKNDPIRQKGFQQFLKEEVVFDLDDKGSLIALNKEGKPFTNPAGNVYKTPQEVINEYADKAKIKANNNLNPARQQQHQAAGNGQQQGGNVPVHKYPKRS